MKFALLLLLLSVLVISEADGWRRRRRWFRVRFRRIRVPRIRVRKIFRPVVKIIKKIKPVLKKIVKVAAPILLAPILAPIQKKICQPPEGKRSYTERFAPADHINARSEHDLEDKLEQFEREGRALEGFNDLIRDERDVQEVLQALDDPGRSKGLSEKIGKLLCGKPPEQEQEPEQEPEPDQEVTEIVTNLQTIIEYVTEAPTTAQPHAAPAAKKPS